MGKPDRIERNNKKKHEDKRRGTYIRKVEKNLEKIKLNKKFINK